METTTTDSTVQLIAEYAARMCDSDLDEDARYDAAIALARLGYPAIVAANRMIECSNSLARYMACYVLGQVSDPSKARYVKLPDGIPVLMQVLGADSDDNVRASAACALGHHDAVESVPLLCQLVTSASIEARFSAVWALGCFGESRWDQIPHFKELAQGALLYLTHDIDDEIRDWAVFGLHQGDHDTAEVRSRFWQALDDNCPEVRGESAAGLAKFGDRTLIPRLIELLKHDVLSPCYFEAAEVLDDPILLPAVLAAEQRWRDDLGEGEEMHSCVTTAVAALKAKLVLNS